MPDGAEEKVSSLTQINVPGLHMCRGGMKKNFICLHAQNHLKLGQYFLKMTVKSLVNDIKHFDVLL